MSREGNYIASFNPNLSEVIKCLPENIQNWYWFREKRRKVKFQRGHNLKVA